MTMISVIILFGLGILLRGIYTVVSNQKKGTLTIFVDAAAWIILIVGMMKCYQITVDWDYGFRMVCGGIFAAASGIWMTITRQKHSTYGWLMTSSILLLLSNLIDLSAIAKINVDLFIGAVPIAMILSIVVYWLVLSELDISSGRKKLLVLPCFFANLFLSASICAIIMYRTEPVYLWLIVGALFVTVGYGMELSNLLKARLTNHFRMIAFATTYLGQIVVACSMIFIS